MEPDGSHALRRFRVSPVGDPHHGRVVSEASFEAAAIAFADHFPFAADAGSDLRLLVHDVDSGHEHRFSIHLDAPRTAAPL